MVATKTFTQEVVPDQPFPISVVASDVMGGALNTKARKILGDFSFTSMGAISIGDYGVTGNIRISPNGIVGYNSATTQTFLIDATTGDAMFRGTLHALAGDIGGFTIESSYLYAGSGSSIAGLSPADYPFWAGATYANRAAAPFWVKPTGEISATSGTIGGWVLAPTTLTGGDTILENTGIITVSNGNDKIVLTTATGVGYVDFYAGGTLRGRMRGNTAAAGGVQLTQGDFAITNGYSFLAKGTGGSYFTFGTDGNRSIISSTSDDVIYFEKDAGTTLATLSGDQLYLPSKLQLAEVGAPGNPSGNTALIYLNSANNNLEVRFDSGAAVTIATHP